jgi:hypothetical protein
MRTSLAMMIILGAGPALADEPATQPAGDPFLTTSAPSTRPLTDPADLLHYDLSNGLLLPTTRLRAGEPQIVYLPNLTGPVNVTIMQRAPRVGRYTPDSIQIIYTQQNKDDMVRTSVLTVSGQINLARDYVTAGDESTVQFVQQANAAVPEQSVTLHVQHLGVTPEPDDREQYTAASFPAFIRQYPMETARYVRPMIEAFSPQPHLFVVPDELAWTIFPEAFPVDDAVKKRIERLVATLNADDFRQREQAAADIQAIGIAAAPVLVALKRGPLTPEQAERLDGILSRLKPPFTTRREELRTDPSFLIDCLMSENALLRKVALAQLCKVTSQKIEFPLSANTEERVKAAYALRDRLLNATTQPAQ